MSELNLLQLKTATQLKKTC